MTQQVTLHAMQIERTVRIVGNSAEAEFNSPFGWFICRAWITPAGSAHVQTRNTAMTVEQASMVIVGLQLALDWIAERKQGFIEVGHICPGGHR